MICERHSGSVQVFRAGSERKNHEENAAWCHQSDVLMLELSLIRTKGSMVYLI